MLKPERIITVIGLIVIALVACILYKKEQARQHQYEMWLRRCELVKKVEPLDEGLTKGKRLLSEKDYAGAKKALEATQKDSRGLTDALDVEVSHCQNDVEKQLFLPTKSQVEEIEKQAEDILMSEELRYGAEGLVLFEGRWVSPARVKEIEEKRFADAQRAKGLVLFDDKWMTPDERTRIKEEKFASEQRAKGLVFFNGEWITRDKMKELVAERRKEASATAAKVTTAITAALTPAPTQGAFTPENKAWMLDDFESGAIAWQPEQWADPAQLEIGSLEGSKALKVSYAGGQQQKAALAHGMRPMDITSRAKILMDVQNNGKKSVKISIMIGADQAYETRERSVGAGLHKDVAFEITGAVFKCASDGWQQYQFTIGRPQAVNRITLMINTAAQILVDNIRLAAP